MLPGPAKIVECPHCKGTKELMSIISGNTFWGHQWWDLKKDYPMMPRLSAVQKCPHCGKYFMLAEAKSTTGEDCSGDKGKLSHGELREAWAQMKESLSGRPRVIFLLEYLWAFNDAFQRETPPPDNNSRRGGEEAPAADRTNPTDEEWAEFEEIVRELVATFPVQNRLIHAEFLREARLFDEAMAIVDQEGEQTEEPYKTLAGIIRERCLAKNSIVGEVFKKDNP